MLQLLSPDLLAVGSAESCQHPEGSVKTIAYELSSPTHDAIGSIRIGLRDVASETARNIQQLSQATVEQALEIS